LLAGVRIRHRPTIFENHAAGFDKAGRRGNRRRCPCSREGGEARAGINTSYIFGFTEGADTERAREREIENDTLGRFGKGSGMARATTSERQVTAYHCCRMPCSVTSSLLRG